MSLLMVLSTHNKGTTPWWRVGVLTGSQVNSILRHTIISGSWKNVPFVKTYPNQWALVKAKMVIVEKILQFNVKPESYYEINRCRDMSPLQKWSVQYLPLDWFKCQPVLILNRFTAFLPYFLPFIWQMYLSRVSVKQPTT